MKTNPLPSNTVVPNPDTPSTALEDNLRTLRLGYLLENARQSAEQGGSQPNRSPKLP
jgi:hypothetical protein